MREDSQAIPYALVKAGTIPLHDPLGCCDAKVQSLHPQTQANSMIDYGLVLPRQERTSGIYQDSPRLQNMIRVTVGRPEENRSLIDRLQAILTGAETP